ncbi:GNAT family N-acetyltransferase [Anatilimnocola floriformis]|uniref:GNAT family N-acetyltransferase n=1 Tax=Anatilimnocola floriformis TaxID=2948575 RepID=UPI0020C1D6A4|nr:GNAT family N-acetyltransferase [Anatilimnocola floriformis]
MKFDYGWLPGNLVTEAICNELSVLFSAQYGVWSMSDPGGRGGEPIRFSPSRIRNLLRSTDSKVAMARLQGQLVGYAIAVQTNVKDYGVVSWVTQLVVHSEHRHAGIGKTLLFCIWGFSDHYAWGLTSANPYAVRALERATRRRCLPVRIRKNVRKLLSVGAQHVPYIKPETEKRVTRNESSIDTDFFVDRTNLPAMVENASKTDRWELGTLQEGWEWLAFTFHDQKQISLTPNEIRTMLDASDDITRQAYSRMTNTGSQLWARHTNAEVDFIVEACKLQQGETVLDLGCGRGRHVHALSSKGYVVTGVDYVDTFVEEARAAVTEDCKGRSEFVIGECRDIRLERRFDAVVCLYDVIGTYVDDFDNAKILATIVSHLKPGGIALLSVMNLGLTKRRAQNHFSLESQPDRLLSLQPSKVMEATGDVFDPRFFMIDTDTGVVYRKEQFAQGSELPVELIVRDRRFEQEEIEKLCTDAGLEVIWSRFVRAGAWQFGLDRSDDHAKEILVLCRRPA